MPIKHNLFCQISYAFCFCARLPRPLFGVGEENVMSRVSERRLSQPNAIKVAPTQAWRGRLDEFGECKTNKMVTRYIPVGRKFFSDSGCCALIRSSECLVLSLWVRGKVKGQGLMGLGIESDKLTMLTQLYFSRVKKYDCSLSAQKWLPVAGIVLPAETRFYMMQMWI